MNDGKVDWQGSYVAAVTPFSDDGEIDKGAFSANLEFILDSGGDGLVISGCTGEAWALSDAERLELFRRAVEVSGGRAPVIAGTGGISTRAVVDLSRAAKDAGVSGVMVLPPYYCMANHAEVVAHYATISREAAHPILLYNIPRRVGFNLTPEVCVELAELEWVVAIKESSGDFIQVERTIHQVGDRLSVFAGHSAERAVPSLLMGARGFVSSMESQVMGREAIEMYDLVQQGELERARSTQLKTLALDEAMRRHGTFPANLKGAMNLLGRKGGVPRPPLRPLSSSELAGVAGVLESLGIEAAAA